MSCLIPNPDRDNLLSLAQSDYEELIENVENNTSAAIGYTVHTTANSGSLLDKIRALYNKKLQIKNNSLEYLQKFETLYFKYDNQSAAVDQEFGYTDNTPKIVLFGTINGREEAIMALPESNLENFNVSANFVNRVKSQLDSGLRQLYVNKTAFMNSVYKYYKRQRSAKTVNNPILRKQEGNKYNLRTLKEDLGSDYDYFYSSPYLVTDHIDGRFKNIPTGSSFIFYNKFPSNNWTVNELVARGVTSDLGIIMLNEGEFTTDVREWLNSINNLIQSGEYSNPQTRLLVSNYQMKFVLEAIKQYDSNMFDTLAKLMMDRTATFNVLNPSAMQLLSELRGNDRILNILQDIVNINISEGGGFTGFQINPTIFSTENMKSSSYAPVYTSTKGSEYRYYIDEFLFVKDLNRVPVSPPSINFSIDTETDLNNLFNIDNNNLPKFYNNPNFNNNPITDFTDEVDIDTFSNLQSVEVSIAELMESFKQFGIGSQDLQRFLNKYFNDLIFDTETGLTTEKIKERASKLFC